MRTGLRYTAFATNTRSRGPDRQLADLGLRHRGVVLHLPAHAPWSGLVLDGLTRLRALCPRLSNTHPAECPITPVSTGVDQDGTS